MSLAHFMTKIHCDVSIPELRSLHSAKKDISIALLNILQEVPFLEAGLLYGN